MDITDDQIIFNLFIKDRQSFHPQDNDELRLKMAQFRELETTLEKPRLEGTDLGMDTMALWENRDQDEGSSLTPSQLET